MTTPLTAPMTAPRQVTSTNQAAKRAAGAMFLTFFGTLWASWWALHTPSATWMSVTLVLVAGGLLFRTAHQRYQQRDSRLDDVCATQQQINRRFHIINLGQWLAVIVVANVLINLGKPDWVVVAVMAIVGLHFAPLARLFGYRAHYVLAAVLTGWALAYPWILTGGPADPAGCLGAGLILWGAAINSLRNATNWASNTTQVP